LLSIGHALVRPVLCVTDDVPLGLAAALLERAPSAYGLPVVDRESRLLGVLPRATVALLLTESDGAVALPAREALLPTFAVDEKTTLSQAFSEMCRRHAREIAVIGRDGDLVGTLSDVDALRFVAYFSRTGAPPRLDQMPRVASGCVP
jgi:CBS domain-containing protein